MITEKKLYFLHPETKEKINDEDFYFMNNEDLIYLLTVTLLAISSMDSQIESFSMQAAALGIYQDRQKFLALKRARSVAGILSQRIHLQQGLNKKKEHLSLTQNDYLMFKTAVRNNVSPEVLARIHAECKSLRNEN